jgi:hypothetical protein
MFFPRNSLAPRPGQSLKFNKTKTCLQKSEVGTDHPPVETRTEFLYSGNGGNYAIVTPMIVPRRLSFWDADERRFLGF